MLLGVGDKSGWVLMYMRGDALALVTQVVKQSGVAWVTGWVFINMWGDSCINHSGSEAVSWCVG